MVESREDGCATRWTGTACAFGGEALDELYITTAHEFWDADKLAKHPHAGGLYKVTREALAAALGPGVAGVPMHHFKAGDRSYLSLLGL